VGEENEPPAPPSVQEIVPEGAVGELAVSVTVVVKVIVPTVKTEAGLGETAVEVG